MVVLGRDDDEGVGGLEPARSGRPCPRAAGRRPRRTSATPRAAPAGCSTSARSTTSTSKPPCARAWSATHEATTGPNRPSRTLPTMITSLLRVRSWPQHPPARPARARPRCRLALAGPPLPTRRSGRRRTLDAWATPLGDFIRAGATRPAGAGRPAGRRAAPGSRSAPLGAGLAGGDQRRVPRPDRAGPRPQPVGAGHQRPRRCAATRHRRARAPALPDQDHRPARASAPLPDRRARGPPAGAGGPRPARARHRAGRPTGSATCWPTPAGSIG